MAFAEKEKAAAQAGRERADALRARLAATPEPLASPRPPATPRRDGPTPVSALRLLGKAPSAKPDGGSTIPSEEPEGGSTNPIRRMATPRSPDGAHIPISS